jgi:hypothetical protein
MGYTIFDLSLTFFLFLIKIKILFVYMKHTTITRICQWCHDELGELIPKNPLGDFNTFRVLNDTDFCGPYCSKKYNEIKKVMKDHPKLCNYCNTELEYMNWYVKGFFFCHGKCMEMFEELKSNEKLKKLKSEILDARSKLTLMESKFDEMSFEIMENKKKSIY